MFTCPVCLGALRDEPAALFCAACERRYEKVDGTIPVFAENHQNHWGWVPRETVARVVREKAVKTWDEIMRDVLSESPGLMHQIVRRSTDEARAAGKFLLSLSPQSRVLDIGCGLGAFAVSFARTSHEVVAIDLILEHLRWIRPYSESVGTTNMVLACAGDSPHLPFAAGSFDAVVMSGVLEYVALSSPGEPRAIQQAFLRDIARILKPQGQIYIGIENRLSYRYFLGRREEHTKMRFVSLLPRRLANAMHKRSRGRELRIYTHPMSGYRRLLDAAGFKDMQVFYPLPKYSRIATLLPLEGGSRDSLLPAASFRVSGWVDRWRSSAFGRYFARSFVIIGQRSKSRGSLLGQLVAAAREHCTQPMLANGASWNLNRYEVRRRTGKLYLHLTASDGSRLLAKVPLDPTARQQVRASYDTMSLVHQAPGVSSATKAVVPRVFGSASVGGHEIVLEEWRPGVQVRYGGPLRGHLVSQSMRFLIGLHTETQDRVKIDDGAYTEYFQPHFDRLGRWFAAAELQTVEGRISRLNGFCREQVLGAELPIVLRQGDFSLTNCLFDPRTLKLAVIVDWDLSETRGLPLTDAIRLLLHANRQSRGANGRLLEVSLRGVPELLGSPEHRDLYADYMRALNIEARLFTPLAVVYWAQLVNRHYAVPRCRWDVAWRGENLIALLERWEKHLKL